MDPSLSVAMFAADVGGSGGSELRRELRGRGILKRKKGQMQRKGVRAPAAMEQMIWEWFGVKEARESTRRRRYPEDEFDGTGGINQSINQSGQCGGLCCRPQRCFWAPVYRSLVLWVAR